MPTQLYLWESLRQKYINDLTWAKTMFLERIEPIFANAEQEAEDYQNELWHSIMRGSCDLEDNPIDPRDYVDSIQEQSFERYELLSLMHYRNTSMWIACLCQVWEQQLYSFILNEAKFEGLKYEPNDLKKGFSFCKEVFELHQQPFSTLTSWSKIKELRTLVNVIKHAEGDSEKRLRSMRPEYFVQQIDSETYDLMSLYHTTLLEQTLQIKTQDFINYYDALVQFWNELPERMYTKD